MDDVSRRARKWLRRHGHVGPSSDDAASNETREPTALESCTAIAQQKGTFGATNDDGDVDDSDGEYERPRFAASAGGFNVHAGVYVRAGDDVGRERLFRYGARPPLALDRISVLPDGRIAYRVKYPRGPKTTHRIMTPLEFLARLAAIIPTTPSKDPS